MIDAVAKKIQQKYDQLEKETAAFFPQYIHDVAAIPGFNFATDLVVSGVNIHDVAASVVSGVPSGTNIDNAILSASQEVLYDKNTGLVGLQNLGYIKQPLVLDLYEEKVYYSRLADNSDAPLLTLEQLFNHLLEKKQQEKFLCPLCGSEMVLRKGKYGYFYGCNKWRKTGCQAAANSNRQWTKKTQQLIDTKSKIDSSKKKKKQLTKSDTLLNQLLADDE